jgi:hypothetical protein
MKLDAPALAQIDRVDSVRDPVGPEFMAPPPAAGRLKLFQGVDAQGDGTRVEERLRW